LDTFIPVKAKLNIQHHYFRSFRNPSNAICCSRNTYYQC